MAVTVANRIRLGTLDVLMQVSTDDLIDLINDSIIVLAVGLPVAAMVLIGFVYVVFLWEVSRWWRATVVCGAVALVFLGLAALGEQALRELGIAAMLDAVNTPMLAAVTSLPLAAALLRGGLVFGVLAAGLAVLGVVTKRQEPLDVDSLELRPDERRTVRFVAGSLSPGERTRDCTRLENTGVESIEAVVLRVSRVPDEQSENVDTSDDLEARAWLNANGTEEFFFGDANHHDSFSGVVGTETRVALPEEGLASGRRFCFELARPEDATGEKGRSSSDYLPVELAIELEPAQSELSATGGESPESEQSELAQ